MPDATDTRRTPRSAVRAILTQTAYTAALWWVLVALFAFIDDPGFVYFALFPAK